MSRRERGSVFGHRSVWEDYGANLIVSDDLEQIVQRSAGEIGDREVRAFFGSLQLRTICSRSSVVRPAALILRLPPFRTIMSRSSVDRPFICGFPFFDARIGGR